jgi:hypothetical protein
MGHEHRGRLPKTQRWTQLVGQLSDYVGGTDQVRQISSTTLNNVQSHFLQCANDPSVVETFRFLVELATAARTGRLDLFESDSQARFQSLSPIVLSNILADRLGYLARTESGNLAKEAAVDALAMFYLAKRKQIGLELVPSGPGDDWRDLGSTAEFCALARNFFGSFLNRYLAYFIDREASNAVRHGEARRQLTVQVSEHIRGLAQHSLETALITQSFAAGWFTKNAAAYVPTRARIRGFLAIAFGKLRDEVRREASP